MDAPERIWYEHDSEAGFVWLDGGAGVEYVRADLYERLRAAILEIEVKAFYGGGPQAIADICDRALTEGENRVDRATEREYREWREQKAEVEK